MVSPSEIETSTAQVALKIIFLGDAWYIVIAFVKNSLAALLKVRQRNTGQERQDRVSGGEHSLEAARRSVRAVTELYFDCFVQADCFQLPLFLYSLYWTWCLILAAKCSSLFLCEVDIYWGGESKHKAKWTKVVTWWRLRLLRDAATSGQIMVSPTEIWSRKIFIILHNKWKLTGRSEKALNFCA